MYISSHETIQPVFVGIIGEMAFLPLVDFWGGGIHSCKGIQRIGGIIPVLFCARLAHFHLCQVVTSSPDEIAREEEERVSLHTPCASLVCLVCFIVALLGRIPHPRMAGYEPFSGGGQLTLSGFRDGETPGLPISSKRPTIGSSSS
jgi:hypothetical protein